MSGSFIILALVTLIGAIGAMNFGRLVYCALSLVAAFVGLAGLYLQLSAQFLGFVQVLVYVGAVAILIVFALLLTQNANSDKQNVGSRSWAAGAGVALGVFLVLGKAIIGSSFSGRAAIDSAPPTVKNIGHELMTTYVIPLEAMALLLTAALIGAVVIAQRAGRKEGRQ